MILDDPIFIEPGLFNPQGNLTLDDVPTPFVFDLTQQGTRPRLERTSNDQALVRVFTDLKRHSMGEMLAEQPEQGGVPGGVFLTKKLWGFASEPHFLHHCRATLISDAILAHGGEAQAARDALAALRESEWADVIEFLKSLVVLPGGTSTFRMDRGAECLPISRQPR
jgi:hypothetical protein